MRVMRQTKKSGQKKGRATHGSVGPEEGGSWESFMWRSLDVGYGTSLHTHKWQKAEEQKSGKKAEAASIPCVCGWRSGKAKGGRTAERVVMWCLALFSSALSPYQALHVDGGCVTPRCG